MKTTSRMATLALSLLLIAGSVRAQDTADTDAQDSPRRRQNLVTFNPFLAAFGWYSAEFERALNDQFSAGVSGSYLELGEDGEDQTTYGGGDVFLRMFPEMGAPGGLWFGGNLGFRSITDQFTEGFLTDEIIEESYTWFAAGFSIGFTYLFGVRDNYVLSVGAGVTKVFGDANEDSDLSTTLPTIRLVNLGLGF
jgi:hypothetical protein